nr:hypothetical protein [Tanacetum cinerariifolium]
MAQLCAHLIRLREMNEAVLVWSNLSSSSTRKMSIYNFMSLSTWELAKFVEVPHEFTDSILQRVQNHTTAPATKGTLVPLLTLGEIAGAQPNPKLAKKTKSLIKRKAAAPLVGPFEPGTLDGNEGTSSRASSAPPLRLGKRLGSPPNVAYDFSSSHATIQKGAFVVGSSRKARADVIRRQLDLMDMLAYSARVCDQDYDHIPEDHFATALKRTESLFSVQLSHRMNVLTALLVSYGVEMNSQNKELHSLGYVSSEEVRKLKAQLSDAKVAYVRSLDELVRTDAKLSDQALIVRDLQNDLAFESDVFNAALACVLTFSITFGVERGLRMKRIDAQFEEALQNVSNLFLGAETEFNKFVVDIPSVKFPFLAKISKASEG